MKEMIEKCAKASDDELTSELRFVTERERRNLATVLIALGEYGYRRLYREEGYHSLFEYCLRVLRYDESAAYRHITAARVARQYPDILPLVASGELTLTSILILSPVLTADNREQMFKEARGKSRRELETVVAGLSPLPARMDYVRVATTPAPPPAWGPLSGSSSACESVPGALEEHPPREWQAVMPISLERVRVGFDAALVLMKLIDRAKLILRHKYPEGRLEDILRDALEILIERKDPQKRLAPKEGEMGGEIAPAPEPRFLAAWRGGRYIAARVKRAVWQRDEGRCTWRFDDGRPCGSREALEFDHYRPFAKGGRSDDARNVRLLCRMHNRMAAEAGGLIGRID